MRREDIRIGFFILLLEIAATRIRTIATRIDAHQINRRLTINDPFRELPACATGSSHAKTMAFIQPHIRQIPCGADNRVTIGRVSNRAIIDFLDADFAKGRNALNRGFDMRRQPVEILLEQIEARDIIDRIVRQREVFTKRNIAKAATEEKYVQKKAYVQEA